MYELDAPTLFVSLLVTWAIGLAPPLLIRYALLQRPIGTWAAIGVCAGFWLLNILIFTAMGSRSKTHGALVLVALVSFWILKRRGRASTRALHDRPGIPAADIEQVPRSHLEDDQHQEPAPTTESHSKSNLPMLNVEEEYWAKALAEYEGANRRPGLWARVFSEAQGNEAIAKAKYLKHRAEELSHEHQQQALAQEHANREAVEKARLARISEDQRAYELLPKGKCPNCEAVIPLASERCPKCAAIFTGEGWKVIPI